MKSKKSISEKCSYDNYIIHNETLEDLKNKCNYKSLCEDCVLNVINGEGNYYCFSVFAYRALVFNFFF